jgi:hypothetical protein
VETEPEMSPGAPNNFILSPHSADKRSGGVSGALRGGDGDLNRKCLSVTQNNFILSPHPADKRNGGVPGALRGGKGGASVAVQSKPIDARMNGREGIGAIELVKGCAQIDGREWRAVLDRDREKRLSVPPPKRTGGFPANGFPVSGLPRRGLTDLNPSGAERPHEPSPGHVLCPASLRGDRQQGRWGLSTVDGQPRWPRWFRVA